MISRFHRQITRIGIEIFWLRTKMWDGRMYLSNSSNCQMKSNSQHPSLLHNIEFIKNLCMEKCTTLFLAAFVSTIRTYSVVLLPASCMPNIVHSSIAWPIDSGRISGKHTHTQMRIWCVESFFLRSFGAGFGLLFVFALQRQHEMQLHRMQTIGWDHDWELVFHALSLCTRTQHTNHYRIIKANRVAQVVCMRMRACVRLSIRLCASASMASMDLVCMCNISENG